MDENDKKLITGLFNEWLDLQEERKEISKDITNILKKNKEYKELKNNIKILNDSLKELRITLIKDLDDNFKEVNNNIKHIISDTSDKLEVDNSVVNKLFNFQKIKLEKDKDELKEIVDCNINLFENL